MRDQRAGRGLRLGVPVALLGLLALGPVSHADVDPGSGLSSYTLAASAPGLAVEGLYKDVALTLPETTSTLTTGGVGSGLATLAWPGPVLGNLGTTILVLQPTAPSQVTMLNDPVKAQARTAGPQQAGYTSLPGTVMAASAVPDHVTASSRTGPSTTLPVGDVGVVSAGSEVGLRGASTAFASSESDVEHLSLAGGQVEIGAVRSTASATSDGRDAHGTGGTTVTGLLVGGVAVTVDGSGLHVAGQGVPNPVPLQTVTDTVKALGLTLELTQPHEVRQGGSVRFVSAALVVLWSQAGQQYALTLGRASVSVDASPMPAQPTFVSSGSTGTTTAPGAVSGGSAGPAAAPTGVTGVTSGGSGPGPVTLPAPVAAVVKALTPVALALAGGAPLPLALTLLLGGGLLAVVLGGLPARLLVAAPATDCEDLP